MIEFFRRRVESHVDSCFVVTSFLFSNLEFFLNVLVCRTWRPCVLERLGEGRRREKVRRCFATYARSMHQMPLSYSRRLFPMHEFVYMNLNCHRGTADGYGCVYHSATVRDYRPKYHRELDVSFTISRACTYWVQT